MTELKFYENNDLVKVMDCTEIAPQVVCEIKNYYGETCEVESIHNKIFEKWYSEGLNINGKVIRQQRNRIKLPCEKNGEYPCMGIRIIVKTNQLRPVELLSNKRFILTEVFTL